MLSSIRPAEFILGKTLLFFLIGLFDVSLIAVIGTLRFQVPFRGQLSVLFTGSILFLLGMLGVGPLISTVSATEQQALVTSFFFIMFIMPAVTFSGFGFPISTIAAIAAVPYLREPVAVFPHTVAGNLSEGSRHRYPLAANVGHGRLGSGPACYRGSPLPQSNRLILLRSSAA
jgi:ABC-2 type transport system permease protein